MENTVKIFKALSDTNRMRILKMLELKPLCVCEITEILQLATSTVSKHLAILKDAGFISDEKDGKWVNYQLNLNADDLILKQLQSLLPVWINEDATVKSDIGKLEFVDRNVICNIEI